jgi:MFS-type transporter involved in bile tolerance (Atg22 family)
MTAPHQEASKLGQFSWALFDWANQPFFTVVTTFIFAPYFANVMVGNAVEGQASPFSSCWARVVPPCGGPIPAGPISSARSAPRW